MVETERVRTQKNPVNFSEIATWAGSGNINVRNEAGLAFSQAETPELKLNFFKTILQANPEYAEALILNAKPNQQVDLLLGCLKAEKPELIATAKGLARRVIKTVEQIALSVETKDVNLTAIAVGNLSVDNFADFAVLCHTPVELTIARNAFQSLEEDAQKKILGDLFKHKDGLKAVDKFLEVLPKEKAHAFFYDIACSLRTHVFKLEGQLECANSKNRKLERSNDGLYEDARRIESSERAREERLRAESLAEVDFTK